MSDKSAKLVILADSRVVLSGPESGDQLTADMAHSIALDIRAWLEDSTRVLVLRGPVEVIDLRKHP